MSLISTFIAGLLPKSKREAALYVFVLLCALRPWIVTWILYPHDPPAVRTIYRSPEGDYEYFVLTNALARGNFGENAVYELQHTGVQSFPVASIFFHAICTALLGSLWGYILADIIVTAFFFFLLRAWCRFFSSDAIWTTLIAAIYVSGLPSITDGYTTYFHWGLWGMRYARPFVTDIYLMAGVVLLTRMAWHPETRGKLSCWIFVGAILSFSLQSFIYSLPMLGLGTAFVALLWIIQDRPSPGRMALNFAAVPVTFLVLSTPFIYQRLHELPEVVTRLGLVPVDPWRIWFHTSWWKDTAASAGLIILGFLAALNAGSSRPIPGRVFGFLATLQFAAYFSLPLAALGGSLIQASHFFNVAPMIQSFLLIALLVREAPRFAPRVLQRPVFAVLVLILGFALVPYHVIHRRLMDGPVRNDVWHPPGPQYHRAFTALVHELDQDKYKDDLVAAMTDMQVYAYWVGFHAHYAFFPHSFLTTVSKQQLEDRVLWFCREEGLSTAEASRFWYDPPTLPNWLGSCYYQCSSLYHWAPADDYYPADAVKMQGEVDFTGFWLALPISENERLKKRYAEILAMDESQRPRLDLIILAADTKFMVLPAPDPSRYVLTYHDEYFRVYQAIRK